MPFDIYEEKILTFSNVVMKQNRFVSYVFMALYIFSFLKRGLTSLFNSFMAEPQETSEFYNPDKIGTISPYISNSK